ncbi:hypothetical protein VTL71DRAFT_3676 [Oculimacula yallundae]|uniref:CENP-V/GFA domain-containing protein n=1 Tax=Oculimacula yallundae TaxID=86028 RepID=A0ABR4C3Q3_9HELO
MPLPPSSLILHGGCDCTSIRYNISIPELNSRPVAFKDVTSGEEIHYPHSFLDHCNRCRRVSGAIIQAWLTVPQDWVEWIQTPSPDSDRKESTSTISTTDEFIKFSSGSGLPVTNYASSPGIVRSFCGRCGTNLAFVNVERDMGSDGEIATLDIVLGSLDTESLEREEVRPERHTYWDSGVGWVKKLVTDGDVSLSGGKAVPKQLDGDISVVL